MSIEDQSKYKNAFWWITSIAVSVLCCSVLFVLFASYLVELKADIRDNMMHVNAMEDRQNQILSQIQLLAKRLPPPLPVSSAATPTVSTPDTTSSPSEMSPTSPSSTDMPTATPPSSVTVPVMPAPADK